MDLNIQRCTFCKSDENIEHHHIIPRRYGRTIGIINCCHKCHQIADRLSDSIIQMIINNKYDIQILQNKQQKKG